VCVFSIITGTEVDMTEKFVCLFVLFHL